MKFVSANWHPLHLFRFISYLKNLLISFRSEVHSQQFDTPLALLTRNSLMRNKTRSCEASLQKHPLGTFRPENLYWRGPAVYPCSWPLGTFRQWSLYWRNVPPSLLAPRRQGLFARRVSVGKTSLTARVKERWLFLQATVRPNNAKPSPVESWEV